jgi:hypothetical protein
MFVIEVGNLDTDLATYHVAIIPRDIDVTNRSTLSKLLGFVSASGGLLVFYDDSNGSEPPVNSLLIKLGLAYTTVWITEDADAPEGLGGSLSFVFARDWKLIADRFKPMINQEEIDTGSR